VTYETLSLQTADGVAVLSLHRPEVHNALNQKLRDELGALPDMHKNPETTARVYDRNKVIGRESV